MTAVTPLFYDLRETATMLRVDYSTAWNLVNSGQLKAMQIGRRWKVTQAAIDAFVQQGTEAVQQRAQSHRNACERIGGRTWASSNEAQPGGSTSPRQVASALDSRLRQLTARPRRNSTTG
ncbi:MAG TPA: helix-turn-helix domain-containing protein [Ottowia sp.]|nr:helix-turn-helix domain-containing protein [Ottowia sp.]